MTNITQTLIQQGFKFADENLLVKACYTVSSTTEYRVIICNAK